MAPVTAEKEKESFQLRGDSLIQQLKIIGEIRSDMKWLKLYKYMICVTSVCSKVRNLWLMESMPGLSALGFCSLCLCMNLLIMDFPLVFPSPLQKYLVINSTDLGQLSELNKISNCYSSCERMPAAKPTSVESFMFFPLCL